MKRIFLCLPLILLGMTMSAQYGTINLKKVVDESVFIKGVKNTTDSLNAALKKEIDMRTAVYNDRRSVAESQKAKGDLTPNQEKDVVDDLNALSKSIQDYSQSETTKINNYFNGQLDKFDAKTKEVIKKIASSYNIKAVFDVNSVVWVDGKDITQEVLEKINGK